MEPMFVSRTATSAIASLAALLVAVGTSACTTGGASSSSPGGAASTSAAAPGTSAPGGGASASGRAGSTAIVPQASTLHWQSCGGQLAGLQCTSLQVPLNYADPGGRKITIALSLVPAFAPPGLLPGVTLVD